MAATILIVTYTASAEQLQTPAEAWRAIAGHIGAIDGLRWKYWLRGDDADRGGVYLFDSREQAGHGAEQIAG